MKSPAARPRGLPAAVAPVLALLLVGSLAACSSGTRPRSAASPAASPSASVPSPSAGATATPTARVSASPTRRPSATPTAAAPSATPVDPLASRPPLETAPPPGLPACSAATLSVADADAVYTSDAVQELFTMRTSGPDCQLPAAYPVVVVLSATGERLGTAQQGGFGLAAPGTGPLTLSRSTSLSFFLASKRDGTCVPAASVSVTLAGTAGGLTAATALQVCDGALGVGPLQRLGDKD